MRVMVRASLDMTAPFLPCGGVGLLGVAPGPAWPVKLSGPVATSLLLGGAGDEGVRLQPHTAIREMNLAVDDGRTVGLHMRVSGDHTTMGFGYLSQRGQRRLFVGQLDADPAEPINTDVPSEWTEVLVLGQQLRRDGQKLCEWFGVVADEPVHEPGIRVNS